MNSSKPVARSAVFSRFVLLAILLVIVVAMCRVILVAWADLEFRSGQPGGIEKAERLIPSNELYPYTRALMLEQSDPTSPEIDREFAKAVAINPRFSDALMAWSVEKEMHGDTTASEQLLLQAQERDRLVRPAWALANFYFRQGDTNRFLAQARESLRIIGISKVSEGRYAISPIYDLCWRSGANAETILAKGIPDVPVILGGYLSFVLNTGRADAAPAIVARMMPNAEPGEMFFFRPYLEDLLLHNHIALAAQTWQRLYERHVVTLAGPNVAKRVLLTNGSFNTAPSDYGFDWRRMFPDSVQFSHSRLEHAYWFNFDGSEPEQFKLLVQIVPVEPAQSYVFQASFTSDVNPEPNGLRWMVNDHKTGQPLKTTDTVTSDVGTSKLVMTFTAPQVTDSVDLTLGYQRVSGTPRINGYYQVSNVTLRTAR